MEEIDNLLAYLRNFITPHKKQIFKQILEQRTRYLCFVLEDINQAHNASAVLRTADCFGIQDVHVIENRNKYQVNKDIALGANQWIDLKKYTPIESNTPNIIQKLRQENYRIIATSPHIKGVALDAFDLSKSKAAIFFGSEIIGLSDYVLQNADEHLLIPMVGFTESLNISVSAAIIAHHLTLKLRKTNLPWQLSKAEKNELEMRWLRKTLKKPDLLIERFYQNNTQQK
jgi:tRNA (guanosine-2'-O-)-methyltransferase